MIKVDLSNIQTVIGQIRDKQRDFVVKEAKLVDETIESGNQKLATKLQSASYSGDGVAGVMPTSFDIGTGEFAIGIAGSDVTFIEFGTGTYYPDNHPMMDEFQFKRGEFGKGFGKNPPWYFRNRSGEIVRTLGNEANRVVYNTAKELQQEMKKRAKEVFSK